MLFRSRGGLLAERGGAGAERALCRSLVLLILAAGRTGHEMPLHGLAGRAVECGVHQARELRFHIPTISHVSLSPRVLPGYWLPHGLDNRGPL